MKRRIARWLLAAIEDQKRWIQEHGGSLAGYAMRYGSAQDPIHYGDGGEAIFAADMAGLRRLENL